MRSLPLVMAERPVNRRQIHNGFLIGNLESVKRTSGKAARLRAFGSLNDSSIPFRCVTRSRRTSSEGTLISGRTWLGSSGWSVVAISNRRAGLSLNEFRDGANQIPLAGRR